MLDNVTKSFGNRPVLVGFSLGVAAGECFGLLGRAGSGKSTVLRILVALTAFDRGTASVDGVAVEVDPQAVRRRIGYMPQDGGIYRRMTAEEDLAFFAGVHGISRPRRRPLATELLDVVGLGDRARHDVERLASVDQRRLAMARTLVHDPDVLLYDEPMAGLEDDDRQALHDEVTTLTQELVAMGKTIILTGRSLADVEGPCARAGVLEGGRLSAANLVAGPVDL